MDPMVTAFNTAVAETASKILGEHSEKKKLWVTVDVFICATKGEN